MGDLRVFRRICHEAAGRTGGLVAEFRISTEPTPNFHQGIIVYTDKTVAVVCLRDTPLLAIAAPRVIAFTPTREAGPLTFLDLPALAAALAPVPEFRLLTTAELAGPIDPAKWSGISRDDVRHWQPRTLGAALFNYWD